MGKQWALQQQEDFERDWETPSISIMVMMKKYGRTRIALHRKAKAMRLLSRKNVPRREWTISEITQFKLDYPQKPMAELCLKYNRTARSLYRRAEVLGIKRNVSQSMILTVTDLEGNLLSLTRLGPEPGIIGRRKAVMGKLLARNKRAIDRGEHILSITHNLECYQ